MMNMKAFKILNNRERLRGLWSWKVSVFYENVAFFNDAVNCRDHKILQRETVNTGTNNIKDESVLSY